MKHLKNNNLARINTETCFRSLQGESTTYGAVEHFILLQLCFPLRTLRKPLRSLRLYIIQSLWGCVWWWIFFFYKYVALSTAGLQPCRVFKKINYALSLYGLYGLFPFIVILNKGIFAQ
jgi:hypothetical protein